MKHKKPRILFLIRDLTAIGGAQLSALRLAAHIKQEGFPVMIMGSGDYRSIKQHLVRFNISTDTPVFPITPPSVNLFGKLSSYWPNIFFILPCFFKLWKYRKHFDILHGSLLMESGLLCAMAGILLGKPSLVKIGSAGPYGDVQRALRVAVSAPRHALFRRITKFVCLTKEIEDELANKLDVPHHQLIRIPNGIDMQRFRPANPQERKEIRGSMGISSDEKVILFVGRLEIKKRVDFLLKAWERVQSVRNVNDRLLIIGEGILRSELENLVKKLRIEKKVTFYGESDNVVPFMQMADIFVLPSVSEGMANVLLESMASSLPVIATNTNGNSEILKHDENALLFQEGDIQDLSDTIIFLLYNEAVAEKLGMNARRVVEKYYNLSSVVQRYGKLYDELLLNRLQTEYKLY